MEHVYYHFDPSKARDAEVERRLRQVFQHLLLAVSGDVELALRWLERLARRHGLVAADFDMEGFRQRLLERGEVQETPTGGLKLTAQGERSIRRDSLERVFRGLAHPGRGDHRTSSSGASHFERLSETRPFQFGDSAADVDFRRSMINAIQRSGLEDFALSERDLEVFESEASTSCATVIAIDISHSMTLYGEDRITPAKQVSLAMVELIRSSYPRDDLSVVVFGDRASEIEISKIPYLKNGPFHTNTREGLELAAQILARKKHPNRQIFLVTDGKPSALTEGGRIYKNPMGLDRKIVNKTLEMGAVLRRKGIIVTTFMLTDDPALVAFVEDFTRLNRGRAYYSQVEQLGSFLFVDYLRNRRRRLY